MLAKNIMTLDESKLRSLFVESLKGFLHKPYIWGGDDPIQGFDCSGFVLEGLKSIGIADPNFDTTAHGLWTRCAELDARKDPQEGDLVFWGSAEKVTHVEVVLLDAFYTIGASGGGSSTKTPADATRQNAYIKIRPLFAKWRKMPLGYRNPFAKILSNPPIA